MQITAHEARSIIAAGEARAEEIGVRVNIAVLDAGAQLKAFSRMDGALLGSIDIAVGKAKTAALFQMATEAVGEFCKPGGGSPGLEQTNGGLVVFGGGLPLSAPDGTFLGALGVSGGAVAEDMDVARAALSALRATS
ncbi:heme-binding protein [Rhizobium sp. CBN3]|uniref:GlcG/HbpS family heme-binding protein n=1 Tax=Rhizobium sp. CBN3 TaxID=3058045 RepID=UPI002672BCB3|nr:heme-binding protein [Rhizobium sp. CBN3]MDO3432137.1 heme-binding protein [Rhizobium sp. CBN3]